MQQLTSSPGLLNKRQHLTEIIMILNLDFWKAKGSWCINRQYDSDDHISHSDSPKSEQAGKQTEHWTEYQLEGTEQGEKEHREHTAEHHRYHSWFSIMLPICSISWNSLRRLSNLRFLL